MDTPPILNWGEGSADVGLPPQTDNSVSQEQSFEAWRKTAPYGFPTSREAWNASAAHYQKELAEKKADFDTMASCYSSFVRDTCEGFDCIPECDKWGHAELCPLTNPEAAWRQMQSRIAELEAQSQWEGIESAPKDGTEVWGWREDCGTMIIRWTSCDAFLTDSEIEANCMDEDELFHEDWFYADFTQGGRLEGSEAPTKWMPLPEPPQVD